MSYENFYPNGEVSPQPYATINQEHGTVHLSRSVLTGGGDIPDGTYSEIRFAVHRFDFSLPEVQYGTVDLGNGIAIEIMEGQEYVVQGPITVAGPGYNFGIGTAGAVITVIAKP